jgi:hypothetical protein
VVAGVEADDDDGDALFGHEGTVTGKGVYVKGHGAEERRRDLTNEARWTEDHGVFRAGDKTPWGLPENSPGSQPTFMPVPKA